MTEQTAEIAALFEQCGFEPNSDFQREILDTSHRFVPVSYTHLTLPTIYSV